MRAGRWRIQPVNNNFEGVGVTILTIAEGDCSAHGSGSSVAVWGRHGVLSVEKNKGTRRNNDEQQNHNGGKEKDTSVSTSSRRRSRSQRNGCQWWCCWNRLLHRIGYILSRRLWCLKRLAYRSIT